MHPILKPSSHSIVPPYRAALIADGIPAILLRLEEARSILQEANEWTGREGACIWRDSEISIEKIQHLIELGSLHLVMLDNNIVGNISYEVEDPIYYPEITDGSTAFVHRLAVRRIFGVQGVGKAMIAWAREKAISQRKAYLRLDCIAERQSLCEFYESLGFTKTDVR